MFSNDLSAQLTAAIQNRQIITFVYDGLYRGVEPFTLGYLHNGNLVLCGFQITGRSPSGPIPDWRLFDLDKIERLIVDEEQFVGIRPGYNPRDSRMSQIITTV